MRPERFELPTYSSGGCRSIQLSYGRTAMMQVYIVDSACLNGCSRALEVETRLAASGPQHPPTFQKRSV